MKKILYYLLHAVVIIGAVCFLVYYLVGVEEPNYSRLSKCVVVLVSYLLAMLGLRKKTAPVSNKIYEDKYRDVLNGTFPEDKKSYKQLLEAVGHYDRDEHKKALKVLEKLMPKCSRNRDYVAVWLLKGWCLDDLQMYNQAIEAYEKTLQYDMSFSRAWSNLGLLYSKAGRMPDAFNAYTNAILYDPSNATAQSNMGVYYIRMGEPGKALEYAMKAMELDSRLYPAMSTASLAYKMLGDDENADKYCRMYGVNGGDVKALKQRLAQM